MAMSTTMSSDFLLPIPTMTGMDNMATSSTRMIVL